MLSYGRRFTAFGKKEGLLLVMVPLSNKSALPLQIPLKDVGMEGDYDSDAEVKIFILDSNMEESVDDE